MEWKTQTFGDWKRQVSQWHSWFAWYPVFITGRRKTLWLQTIQRRLVTYYNYTDTCEWEYK